MGDLLRRAAAFHGCKSLDAFDPVGFAAAGVHLGIDESRPHSVHPDAFLRDLFGETDGKRVDRAFGRRVVDVLARRTDLRGARRNIDDSAPMTSVLRGHASHSLARTHETPDDIGCKYPA